MESKSHWRLVIDGLWTKNQGMVALLGLCPLMAVTSTAINGVGLGIATLLALVLTNVIVASVRTWIRSEIRIPIFVVIIATVVTAIELLMQAYLFEMYLVLGIFVPLIVTNCAVIGRAEAFASKNSVAKALIDGLSMGFGFMLVLIAVGMLREFLGYGTLFRQADLLFGSGFANITLDFLPEYQGFLLAILPPGAFMGLAVIIAMKNKLDSVAQSRENLRLQSSKSLS